MKYPILTLEIERMSHSIQTALIDYNNEIRDIVEESLKNICTPEYLVSRINAIAKKCIEDTIKYEVEYYYQHGKGKSIIHDMVETHFNNNGDKIEQ